MEASRKVNILFIVSVIILVIGIVSVSAAMYQTIKIQSTGQIKGVGCDIFADPEGVISVTKLDWGILEPRESKNITLYIRNTGNVPASLSMYSDTWIPEETEIYVAFVWNYEGMTVPVQGMAKVTFTLTIDQDITGINKFSWNITVIAEG